MSNATPDFRAAAAALLPDLVDLRRTLHQDAEIGLDLPLTQAHVLTALEGLGLEIHQGTGTTSVVAVLRGGAPGPVVLLRGDMDALPVVEENDLEYRSVNGNMHACGHDLHTAGLVGAARLLAAERENLRGTVVFMFQPGEEGYGGAKVMLAEGLLEIAGQRPDAAYAVHVGTGTRGLFFSRPGPLMASSNSIEITLHGQGGHGSNPSQTRDPVPALAELTLALQTMVSRTVSVNDPVVFSVTMLHTGTAFNVIPASATLGATLRTFSTEAIDLVEEGVRRVAAGIASAHRLTAEVTVNRQYPVTVTDPAITARARAVIETHFGADRYQERTEPIMGSEDFSFVLNEIPGAYLLLGALPDHIAPGTTYPHSSAVQFDDAVLADQAAVLALCAWDRLTAEA